MEIYGIPGINTAGNVGDTCVDVLTGNVYKCVYVFKTTTYDGTRYEYEWELIEDIKVNTKIQVNDNIYTHENGIITLPDYPSKTSDLLNDTKDTLINIQCADNKLILTNDKYQMSNITEDTTIILPRTETFTQIHLYLSIDNDAVLSFPDAQYQNEPVCILDRMYEFIFIYVGKWIAQIKEFGKEADEYITVNEYPISILDSSISSNHSIELSEIAGNTIDGENVGNEENGVYVIEMDVASAPVEFGKGGRK